jgi:Zn-dependent peptidase ImmA (M78 family)
MMVSFPDDDMTVARINGKMISWALRRSGASLESLVTSKLSLARLKAWENGDESPSEGAAKKLADRLGIAYPMLYIREVPPDEPIKLPDRRTVDGTPLRNPSIDLLDVLDLTRARQEWYRSEITDSAPKLDFVARFGLNSSAKTVAADMRATLAISAASRASTRNYEEFLKSLISSAEGKGILVMRSAIVAHATKRTLKVEEFRGFVLLDPIVPVVFINDNDAKAAQIFTFAHELAHIWIGAAGISDRKPDKRGDSQNSVELFCDNIAAEFLVSEDEFFALWSSHRTIDRNVEYAARHFRVSSLVILRRARELDRITQDVFFTKVEERYEAYKKYEAAKRKREKDKPGGNFWNSFELRNSAKFNAAVVDSLLHHKTTYAEAGTLFGISPISASRYLDQLGVAK